jgi:hypothetical protein
MNGAKLYSRMMMIGGVWCLFTTEAQVLDSWGTFQQHWCCWDVVSLGSLQDTRKGIIEKKETMVLSLTFDTALQTRIYVSSKITQE